VILVFEPSPVTVGIPAIVLKKFRRTPILFWVQDLWPESLSATGTTESNWILSGVESLVRLIYRHCDKILIQSEAFRASIERLGVKREHIAYFPNSAEPFYRPLSLEREASEQSRLPKGFRVMFGGNIGKAQSFETILDAAELLKDHMDIHWIIVGDGRMFSWVRDEVQKRGLGQTVHLLGRFPAEEMPRYFALADVLLVSLRKQPIFSLTIPSKVQSYLACGKPIIAALEGEGARVIKEAGAGLTPSPENSKELGEAVLAMYRKPEDERRAMGLKGRMYFESHFERTLLLDRLDRWMTELKGVTTACAS
jgi:glycosyltransferase involved in cell wall biosynthesis